MPGVGQVGIYTPLDPSVFLRHDGTVPLTGNWATLAGLLITAGYFRAHGGGNIHLGEVLNQLRVVREGPEIMKFLGVSNNQANLYLKNLRIADLAGVGNRNVIADVNGDLSAP